MRVFNLQGVDCPTCAAKIESALNALPHTNANIDFSTNTLYLSTSDFNLAKHTISRVESSVSIAPKQDFEVDSSAESSQDTKPNRAESIFIISLIALFCLCMAMLYAPFLNQYDVAKPISYAILALIYIIAGKPIFIASVQNLKNKVFFDENSLMLFATIAALCIGEVSEAVAVMLFFRAGEFLESIAIANSKRSINALLQVMPNIAHKKLDSTLIDLHPRELSVGDIIVVKVGEKVPTDGIVLSGKSYLDMRSINGESVPIGIKVGERVIAGALNTTALLEVQVTSAFVDSHIAKIAKLTQEASANKAKTQKVITKFASIYTPIIFAIALCIALIPPLFNGEWHEWIYRALVVMMVSCPCALVIAVPLGYFAAIGRASRLGILFKGSIFLESMYQVKNIIFDKTGTLTEGSFEILEILPESSFSKESLLELAALAEQNSNHPIATCIRAKAHSTCEIYAYSEISGKGVKLECERGVILAGNAALMADSNITINALESSQTSVFIALNGEYAGCIIIGDKIKSNAKAVLNALKANGIAHFGVLSGDNDKRVKAIAKELDISQAYGDLLPKQKSQKLLELKSKWSGKSAFVGDGINDAIVLRQSDVGISINTGEMGNDISKESADIILQNANLEALNNALNIAKRTHSITWQNIIFALFSKVVLIMLGIAGVANMWLAVFGDVGVALLALLNARRIG